MGQEPGNSDNVLAEVQGKKLTLEEVRHEIPGYVYERDSLASIRDYRVHWVNRQILLAEAKRLDLDRNAQIRKKMLRAEEDILTAALLDMVHQEAADEGISLQDAQNYYENHRDQFILKEKHVRYRHMITETMTASQNAKNALMRGNSWEDVANRYSVDPATAIQNSTQFWPISTAASDYNSMHQFLPLIGITEISPIQVENGQFHFVQLREVRGEGEHPDLDWVLDHIREWLLVEKKRQNISAYKRNLYLKAESNNEVRLYDVHNPGETTELPVNLESDTLTSH
ncbi:MAG: hypothetical protein WD266_11785 [Balneolales bacterium]